MLRSVEVGVLVLVEIQAVIEVVLGVVKVVVV
jgi:hypothetical protein